MKLNAVVEQIQHEGKLVQGEASRDITYESHHPYPDESATKTAFASSVAKLTNVNGWSSLSSLSADFALYDPIGRAKPDGPVGIGDFIQIVLPGPAPANWVRVIHQQTSDDLAEFTVQPCPDPLDGNPDQIAHFFTDQSRSTFRVELIGSTLSAYEIGQDEVINNHQPQAGQRGLINTVVAETGWLFYQKMQWKLLTDYLVHL